MAITFTVSKVARAAGSLRMPEAPRELHGKPVEALGASVTPFLPAKEHGLLRAVHTAYALHYPLALTPDMIWLLIAQGFAAHVGLNAERLRGKFVRHAGQAPIRVRRDDFVKGDAANPWPEVFGAFSDGIAEHIGRQRDLVVCDFSTTGPCERAAAEVVLMDAMKHYFRYELHTMCGIPEVTLEGTPDDWRSIRRRARALEEYELGWWIEGLGPVLDQLVATAEGRPDVRFWETFFKHADGSGGPWVRGWINTFFPYVELSQKLERNPYVSSWAKGLDGHFGGGASPASIPSGVSTVPFEWHHLGVLHPMELLGGFVGVAQDAATLALRPAIGWAVRDAVREERVPTQEELYDAYYAAEAQRERIPSEATLIAGKLSGPCMLTVDEAVAIRERLARAGAEHGAQIACAFAGDVSPTRQFPEAPFACRLAVGVSVGTAPRYGKSSLSPVALHTALAAATALPEATWRALDEIIPGGLGGAPALHLVVEEGTTAGVVEYELVDGDVSIPVARAGGGEPAHAIAEFTPTKHAARVAEGKARSGAAGEWKYVLRTWPWQRPRR